MKMLTTFAIPPRTGAMALLIVCLLNGCTEEPVGIDRNGSTSSLSMESDVDQLNDGSTQQTFTAHMTGDNERPNPVPTDGSGQAIFKLSKDGTSLSYKVIVNNVENITQAHIHCGGTDDAGPVVTFLFGFLADGVTLNGVLAEGVITAADVIARPDTGICPGGVATFDQLIDQLKAGHAYINVHTIAFPGGEIRGQIK